MSVAYRRVLARLQYASARGGYGVSGAIAAASDVRIRRPVYRPWVMYSSFVALAPPATRMTTRLALASPKSSPAGRAVTLGVRLPVESMTGVRLF
jgi:hypothetical protein